MTVFHALRQRESADNLVTIESVLYALIIVPIATPYIICIGTVRGKGAPNSEQKPKDCDFRALIRIFHWTFYCSVFAISIRSRQ